MVNKLDDRKAIAPLFLNKNIVKTPSYKINRVEMENKNDEQVHQEDEHNL